MLVEKKRPESLEDAKNGKFVFRCACGRWFTGPWEEARYEAIGHIEKKHASPELRQDMDALEDTIEALITPTPLYSWQEIEEGYDVR